MTDVVGEAQRGLWRKALRAAVAALTAASGVVVALRMYEAHRPTRLGLPDPSVLLTGA